MPGTSVFLLHRRKEDLFPPACAAGVWTETYNMKVLVFGAGIIGSYLTHILCLAGNEVTLLARGSWKDTLEENGLRIHHVIQGRTTIDHPRIIESIDPEEYYNAIFVAMPCSEVVNVLDAIAGANTPIVVMVGNTLQSKEMSSYIRRNSPVKKVVLFGFQATGGSKEHDHMECVRLGAAGMEIGFLDRTASDKLKLRLAHMFRGTRYTLTWHDNMYAYQVCHVASVLPLAYITYSANGDFSKTTAEQRTLSINASKEAYGLIRSLNIPIVPENDADFYDKSINRNAMSGIYLLASRTPIGDMAIAGHCRHAVAEMETLDRSFEELRQLNPDFPMPTWDSLRDAMPPWPTLHHAFRTSSRNFDGELADFRETHIYETVDVDGTGFRCLLCGEGSKVLVFLAGGTGMSELWFPYITALENEYRILTFDYPDDLRTNDELAHGIAGLLDALDIPKAVFVGTSYGGCLAQILAEKYPERTDALILMSTAALSESTISSLKMKYEKMADPIMWALKHIPYGALKPLTYRSYLKHVGHATIDEYAYIKSEFRHVVSNFTKERDAHMRGLLVDLLYAEPHVRDDFAYLDGRVMLLLPKNNNAFIRELHENLIEMMPNPKVIDQIEGGHLVEMLRADDYLRAIEKFAGALRDCAEAEDVPMSASEEPTEAADPSDDQERADDPSDIE